MITIYGLCDPDTGSVEYVGQTVNLKQRLQNHIWDAKQERSRRLYPKSAWVWNLICNKKLPVVKVIQEIETGNPDEWEIYWINEYRRINPGLKNLSDGGTAPRLKRTPEWQAKIVESKKRSGKGLRGEKSKCEICGTEYYLSRADKVEGRRACSKKCAAQLPESIASRNKNFKTPDIKEFCKRGHPLSGDNLRILIRKTEKWRSKEERICRECVRIRNRVNKEKTRGKNG